MMRQRVESEKIKQIKTEKVSENTKNNNQWQVHEKNRIKSRYTVHTVKEHTMPGGYCEKAGEIMRYKKQVFRSLVMVTQLGISVMTPVFLCIFAGRWADTHLKTNILLPLVIIGVLAGCRCGWQMIKMTLEAGERDERQEKEGGMKEHDG